MSTTAINQMQVLGLVDKLLTGPWMKQFYNETEGQYIEHIKGIESVMLLIPRLRQAALDPHSFLGRDIDFFEQALLTNDATLEKLRNRPNADNTTSLVEMLTSCLNAAADVLNRQYKTEIKEMDEISKQDKLHETDSAMCHNMVAESALGMLDAAKRRAKNAQTDYLLAQLRGVKNNVIDWLVGHKDQHTIIEWAKSNARLKRIWSE